MNKRIKELAEQAWWILDATAVSPDFGHPVSFAEKFAELLIFECIKVAIFKNDGIVASDDAGYVAAKAAGRSTAAKMIKKHFGVE